MPDHIDYDGRWRAERQPSGAWKVVRHWLDDALNDPLCSEVDGRPWKGEILPTFHSTFDEAKARADELNQGKR